MSTSRNAMPVDVLSVRGTARRNVNTTGAKPTTPIIALKIQPVPPDKADAKCGTDLNSGSLVENEVRCSHRQNSVKASAETQDAAARALACQCHCPDRPLLLLRPFVAGSSGDAAQSAGINPTAEMSTSSSLPGRASTSSAASRMACWLNVAPSSVVPPVLEDCTTSLHQQQHELRTLPTASLPC